MGEVGRHVVSARAYRVRALRQAIATHAGRVFILTPTQEMV